MADRYAELREFLMAERSGARYSDLSALIAERDELLSAMQRILRLTDPLRHDGPSYRIVGEVRVIARAAAERGSRPLPAGINKEPDHGRS